MGLKRRRGRAAWRRRRENPPESFCVRCGCTESRACEGGCAWRVLDYTAGAGLCTACPVAPFTYAELGRLRAARRGARRRQRQAERQAFEAWRSAAYVGPGAGRLWARVSILPPLDARRQELSSWTDRAVERERAALANGMPVRRRWVTAAGLEAVICEHPMDRTLNGYVRLTEGHPLQDVVPEMMDWMGEPPITFNGRPHVEGLEADGGRWVGFFTSYGWNHVEGSDSAVATSTWWTWRAGAAGTEADRAAALGLHFVTEADVATWCEELAATMKAIADHPAMPNGSTWADVVAAVAGARELVAAEYLAGMLGTEAGEGRP